MNQPGEKGEASIAERAALVTAQPTGDVQRALAELPPIVSPLVRREFKGLLQPWSQGRYTESYRRSGGILNLFTPPWGENQEEVWNKLLAEWKATTYPDDRARRAVLMELKQQWNHTPHPFFAGLTPAQVMVGGGREEAKLADEFLTQVERTLGKREFEGEGDALVKTLLLLRGWQVDPRRNGQTPMQIILAEREELLARRASINRKKKVIEAVGIFVLGGVLKSHNEQSVDNMRVRLLAREPRTAGTARLDNRNFGHTFYLPSNALGAKGHPS